MWWAIVSWILVSSRFIIANGSILEDAIKGKFDSVQAKNLSLFNVTAEEIVHTKTGAKLLFLFPRYETIEKSFAISFTTPVHDETGVTHVLEHSVLSGSRKYPVRFPLNHFSRQSMATFVNAMTYPDRTTYPVATINAMDLYNLASVYLDAVFDPLALWNEDAFAREGWHIELDSLESNLTYSGIVFNEMKGVYSDPSQLRYKHLMHHLMADSSYQWSSGGYPPNIPDLTYEKFREYYLRHYHPSNAQIYYYGAPDSMSDLLILIDSYLTMAADRYADMNLPDLESNPITIEEPDLRPEANFLKFVDVHVPSDDNSPKNSVVLAKVIGTLDLTLSERLALDLLSHLLVGKRETPLYKAIEDAKLGSRLINYGVFDHGKLLNFLVGVAGIEPCPTNQREQQQVEEQLPPASAAVTEAPTIDVPISPIEAESPTILSSVTDDALTPVVDVAADAKDSTDAAPSPSLQLPAESSTAEAEQTASLCPDVKNLLKNLVDEKLDALAQSGFERLRIEATLNRFEFSIRESVANAVDVGLAFMNKVYDSWNYGKDPLEDFALDTALKEVKEQALNNQTFFPDLIKKYLLTERKTVVLQALADAALTDERTFVEQQKLEALKSTMTTEELERLVDDTKEARLKKAENDSPEATATLPQLPLSVLTPNATELPIEVSKYKDIFVVSHDLPTAGIAYLDVYLDLKDLSKDQIFLAAGLIPYLLLHGDTKSRTANELDSLLEFATGDVSLSLDVDSHHRPGYVGNRSDASIFWELSWQCLDQHMKMCMEAIHDVIFDIDFARNEDRAVRWLEEVLAGKEARVLSSPNSYAYKKFGSYFSLTGAVTELTSGLASINASRALLDRAKTDWKGLAEEATSIWNNAFRPDRFVLNAAADGGTLADALHLAQPIVIEPILQRHSISIALETDATSSTSTETNIKMDSHGFNDAASPAVAEETAERGEIDHDTSSAASYCASGFLYERPRWADDMNFHLPDRNISELYVVPSMVAYNHLGGALYEAGSPIQYRHTIPSKILSTDYVFPKIRFVGGAYGAGFAMALSSGTYSFNSYRDPEIAATYDAMRAAPDAMDTIASSVTQEEINQFIIRALAHLDEPISNYAKSQMSFTYWMKGMKKERLDYIRSEILKVNPDDFVSFADALRNAMTDGRPQIAVTFAKGLPTAPSSLSSSMTIFNAVN